MANRLIDSARARRTVAGQQAVGVWVMGRLYKTRVSMFVVNSYDSWTFLYLFCHTKGTVSYLIAVVCINAIQCTHLLSYAASALHFSRLLNVSSLYAASLLSFRVADGPIAIWGGPTVLVSMR